MSDLVKENIIQCYPLGSSYRVGKVLSIAIQ